MLVHRVPYPPDKGDRIRSYHLLEYLARLGEVDLAYLCDEPEAADRLEALGRLCRRVEGVPVSRVWRWTRAVRSLVLGRSLTAGLFESPALRSLIERWLSETSYDAVICFSSAMLPYVLGRGLESRLIVDLVDVDSQKWQDYAGRASGPKAALFRLESRRVQALERAAGAARAVVLVTAAEADLYQRFCPEASIATIPNGVDLDYFRPAAATSEPLGCVFVGQLDYRANVLGLEWFCREVWPTIRAHRPEATFEIVGRNPGAAVRRLGALPGVQVVGTVADVRPHLARARIVVVPLPVARGVQNKVLEALAMGLAVVASPAALDGLGLVPGRDALVAAGSDDWGPCLAALWDDPVRREELGRNGRRFVETYHHWKTCLGRFDELIGVEAGTLPAGRGA